MIFFKKLFYLSLPFIFLITIFLFTDPYKKIWNYDNYLFDYLMLNRGDISTRVYLKNKDIYNYNSFIFGSSRSCSHTSKEWKKYLSKKDVPFSFGSWNEPIKGIYKKISLIDSLNGRIDNAIIIIDIDKTFLKSNYNVIDFDHFLISDKSKLNYYFSDFRNYILNPMLILTSLDYKLFNQKRSYMKGFIGMKKGDLDPVTNDWYPNDSAYDLKLTSTDYEKNKYKFYKRSVKEIYSNKQIFNYEKYYLLHISYILQKHNTNCKIIIAPLYNQTIINPEDLLLLQKLFGNKNVYNYSGKNSITDNIYNYELDAIHYKKSIGNLIYKEIYKK